MADFRKLMLALLAGVMLFATVASAQPFSCNATAVPTLVRSEGIAEMMGDILLRCDGTVPVDGILANIRLRLTTNITSNPAGGSTTALESVLILDEGLTAMGRAFRGYNYDDGSQNVYQAARISDDEIEWAGVWLAGEGSNPFKVIRITNVRGNAQALGDYATIYASVNIVSPTSVPVDNNLLVVADTRPGMTFAVTSRSYKNCEPADSDVILKWTEGFASSFKWQGNAFDLDNIPGGGYLSESGWNPGELLQAGTLDEDYADIGQATQGTRFIARFTNIPAGVSIYAPGTASTGSGLTVWRVEDANSSGAGGTMTNSGGYVEDDGYVVYEVYSNNAISYSTQETVSVSLDVSYSIPGTLGTALVNGSFAPISSVYTMSTTAPEPRFIDSGVGKDKTLFTIGPCRTILLFPYVTNQAGFDTGIAISNTSKDPIGTTNQAGLCKLYYYGNTNGSAAPSVQTSPSIPAGGHLVFGLSGGGGVYANGGTYTACASGACVAPLFQGYIFAICEFQYAHGYAFISDYGARLLAQGYLALIVPDRGEGGRMPVDSSYEADENEGEGLGN